MTIFSLKPVTRLSLVLCCAAVLLTSCMPQSGDSDSVVDSKRQKFAYGISMDVPNGWTVANSVAEGSGDKASFESRVRGGERIMLLDLRRPAQNADGMDARVGLFLVNSGKDFLPSDVAARLTPEEFAKLAKDIMERDRKAAERNKSQNNTVDWKISRESIDGNMAILQRGLGVTPGGQIRVLNWDVYLPDGVGLGIKMLGDPSVPGTESLLEAVARSIQIEKK